MEHKWRGGVRLGDVHGFLDSPLWQGLCERWAGTQIQSVIAPVDAHPRTRVAVHLQRGPPSSEAYSWNSSVTGGRRTVQFPLGYLTWSYFCLGALWVLPMGYIVQRTMKNKAFSILFHLSL